MSEPESLYGLPDAERLWIDPGTVYESEIEPFIDPGDPGVGLEPNMGPWVIEERAVMPIDCSISTARTIVENIVEWMADDLGADDFDHFEPILHDPEVLAAAEALRAAIAAKVTWWQAGALKATHTLAFVDGELRYDGEPFFRPASI